MTTRAERLEQFIVVGRAAEGALKPTLRCGSNLRCEIPAPSSADRLTSRCRRTFFWLH